MNRNLMGSSSYVPESEKIRLFCFYYAGGSALFYSGWNSFLADDIGVYPYEVAGHGERAAEQQASSINEIAAEAAEAISRYNDKPVILFGHSMGGDIAYKTAYLLENVYKINLKGIFISGSVPSFADAGKYNHMLMSELDDEEFCRKLIEFGAIDKRIFRIKNFNELYLPVIRNDFDMTESFLHDKNEKLSCEIMVYGGDSDKIIPTFLLDGWKDFTNGGIKVKIMSGEHFFIRQHIEEICNDINLLASENGDKDNDKMGKQTL